MAKRTPLDQQFLQAVYDNNLAQVRACVAQGASPRVDDGIALLYAAAGSTGLFRHLVDLGLDPRRQSGRLLIAASVAGNLALVEELLQNNLDIPHEERNTALSRALYCNHVDIGQYLLEQDGADKASLDETTLEAVAARNQLAACEFLIETLGIKPTYKALRAACIECRSDLTLVTYLCNKGVDVNGEKGFLTLRAIQACDILMLKVLVHHKADVRIVNMRIKDKQEEFFEPAHLAAEVDLEILTFLIEERGVPVSIFTSKQMNNYSKEIRSFLKQKRRSKRQGSP